MMARKPMSPGAKPLQRTAMPPRAKAMPSRPLAKLDLAGARTKAPAPKTKAKPKKAGRATNAEREHMGRVAARGCCLCEFLGFGQQPAEVHHVRARHGWGRSGHMNTIGLCALHHRGQPGGVHDMGREQFTAHYGISEIELLTIVNLALGVDP